MEEKTGLVAPGQALQTTTFTSCTWKTMGSKKKRKEKQKATQALQI